MKEIINLNGDELSWRKFLDENNALIYHTPEWKIFIEKTFQKIKTEYYAIEEDGVLKTIFPFMSFNHILFGKKIISCGLIEYGGPAGEMDKKGIGEIISKVSERHSRNMDYLEVRDGLFELEGFLRKDFIVQDKYRKFVTVLSDSESLWKNINKQKRKAIRKAEREGVETREIRKGSIDSLYDLYIRKMKDFGSPPLSRDFFRNFYEMLVDKNLAKVFGAYYKDKLVAILVGYTFKERIHIIINVSDSHYLQYRVNDAVHWAFIKCGCGHGFRVFDWGRTRPDSGQFRYKSLWSSEMKELKYYYKLWNKKTVPYLDPTSSDYKFFSKVWRKLPLFLIKRLGPWIRGGLGN